MARTYKDSDPCRAGTGQTNPYETMVGGLVNQAMGTAPQHRWHNTGHTYLHKAAWGWHSALLLGQTLGSVMAFLFLAWMWSHQFDNVILPHPCGFCSTALNCFPLPETHGCLPPPAPAHPSLGFHSPVFSQLVTSSLLLPRKDPGAANRLACGKI